MQSTLSVTDRVFAGWLGKSIGGTLGLPAEGRTERLHFTYYDPVPTVAPPNDDLELQLVWLALVEERGLNLTQRDLADAWLAHIHYMWDEYGRCRWNLRRGVPLSEVGAFENSFVSGMGSPIRSEIWAVIAGGDAALAARYAALDASLDHGREGIAGEVYLAVLQTLVLGGSGLDDALRDARAAIDAGSETAEALELITQHAEHGMGAWASRDELLRRHGTDNFTHAPLNVALILWALLHGEEDFSTSILLAVNGGYDTDCTAATVGATLGLLQGRRGIPARWSDPIGGGVFVGPGIIGIDAPTTLNDLTIRSLALMNRARDSRPEPESPPAPTGEVDLAALPGSIWIEPIDGSPAVAWANGELPPSVKAAGGAEWDWLPSADGQTYGLMALAKAGATLSLDGEPLVVCPPDLPYVPAPHRCPHSSQRSAAAAGSRRVRLELASRDPGQQASAVLSEANHHLAPWSGVALPFPPQLLP